MRAFLFATSLVLGTGFIACDKKSEAPAATSSDEKPSEAPAQAEPSAADTAPKELKLGNGLTVLAPADAKEGKMGANLTVSAMGGKCTAMIAEKSDMSPSFESELGSIEKGLKGGAVKEMKKKDKTGDNDFVIEWTTEKGKFGYSTRRTIGDKAWNCNRVSNDEAGHNCVVQICDSLK